VVFFSIDFGCFLKMRSQKHRIIVELVVDILINGPVSKLVYVFATKLITVTYLKVVVSKIFYFHPDPWGNDPI